MDTPESTAALVIEGMEEFYPEFLVETRLPDTRIARVAFYKTMVELHGKYPINDQKVQELVMLEINRRLDKAMDGLAEYIKGRLSKLN